MATNEHEQRLSSSGREPDQSYFFWEPRSQTLAVRSVRDWDWEWKWELRGAARDRDGGWIGLETTGAVWLGGEAREARERTRKAFTVLGTIERD